MEDFNKISNELELLLEIAEKEKTEDKWDGSYFEIIKKLPSSNKGEIGEKFVHELCKKKEIQSTRNTNTRDSYDILINNKKIEVKTATEDTNNNFQFNGIRYHREYDYVLVLAISPNNVRFNIYESSDIKNQKIGKLVSMEKGAVGSQKLTLKRDRLNDITEFKRIIQEKIII